jgi:pyochelin biosynthetic protein PchC
MGRGIVALPYPWLLRDLMEGNMTGAVTRNNLWLCPVRPVANAGFRLLCFPHAGGAGSFYRPVFARFPADVDVVAVQYPGRQERMAEPQVRDIASLADAVAAALSPGWTDVPFAFFGHSMGAIVAYEVAARMRAAGPSRLFVSGRRSPSSFREEGVHKLGDKGLVADVLKLSGTSSALLNDPDVLAMVLPTLRADYRAIETYVPVAGTPPLDVPIEVLLGDQDPKVTTAEAESWRDHTTDTCQVHVLPGGSHFYLSENPEWTIEMVAAALGLS